MIQMFRTGFAESEEENPKVLFPYLGIGALSSDSNGPAICTTGQAATAIKKSHSYS